MIQKPPDEVNLYDMLEAMIHRIPWKSEAERDTYLELLRKHREINLFGYMAETMSVEKPKEGYRARYIRDGA